MSQQSVWNATTVSKCNWKQLTKHTNIPTCPCFCCPDAITFSPDVGTVWCQLKSKALKRTFSCPFADISCSSHLLGIWSSLVGRQAARFPVLLRPGIDLSFSSTWGKMCHILQVYCLTLVAEAAVGFQLEGWQQFETFDNLPGSEWQPQVCAPSVSLFLFVLLSLFLLLFVCFWFRMYASGMLSICFSVSHMLWLYS